MNKFNIRLIKLKKIHAIIFTVFLILILSINVVYKLSRKLKSFEYIEKAIISEYKLEEETVLEYINAASKQNDADIYEVINGLVDINVLEKFYSDKDYKSFGYGEYYKGMQYIFSNKIGEAIKYLEKSANLNNIGANSFLATYLYSLKRYEEAYKYFEKSMNLKNYTIYPQYIDMKNNLDKYIKMEKLYIKYNQNNINDEDRYNLGKFLLEKDDIVDAYKILKPFLETEDKIAIYSKARFLELEGETKEALNIYKKLFSEYKDTKSAINIVQNSNITTKKNRKKLIELLDTVTEFDKELEFIKANLLYENDNWNEAKKIYDKLLKLEYIPVYKKLAKYYENTEEYFKSLNLYKEAFEKGDISVATNLMDLNENIKILHGDENTNFDYISYLKHASKLGDKKSSLILSEKSNDIYNKKKYAIIALSQGEIKALEILVDIATKENDKAKIKVYTNVLINNK